MTEKQSVAVFQQLRTLFGAGTASGLDDGQLVQRFIDRRDEAAFAALLARHGPLVLGVCRRLLADPADVEDAFQATFLVLVRKAGSLRDSRLLGTWLYKVSYRVALRARAGAGRRTPPTPEGVAPTPADELERRELRAVIDEEIDRLPWRYRRPVVLCYLEGLSHEEAASRLGCAVGTINSRLATARQRLKGRLSRRGMAPSEVPVVVAALPAAARVGVPAALLRVTSQAALGVANGCAVAGAVSATAAVLAEGVLRAMITSKLRVAAAGLLAAGLAVAGLGLLPRGASGALPPGVSGEPQLSIDVTVAPPVSAPQGPSAPKPAVNSDQPARGEVNAVPATGTVLMPDGSPAKGATVEAMTLPEEPAIITRTDDAGRFQLQGVFRIGAQLHARSADGKDQATLWVPTVAVRTSFASPLELRLSPALTHEVTVLADGRPMEGARVAGTGAGFKVRGVTGQDG
jgi:RNA polymerase sigma factor (sigma-70 family)